MMRYLTALILALSSLPVLAQRGGEQETDWFTVEFIVFEQAGDRATPAPDPHVPDTTRAVELEEEFQEAGYRNGPAQLLFPLPDALRFLPAPPEGGVLDQARQRLEGSPRYRPILSMAWRQRVGAFSNPVPVRVRGGGVLGHRLSDDAAPTLASNGTLPTAGLPEGASAAKDSRAIHEVDGTVSLVRGRYLHLNLDLVFRERDSTLVTRGASPAYTANRSLASFPTWRIAERREIRPGQLHYFDHHRFGVIAVARPWLAPGAAEDEAADRESASPTDR